MSIPTPDEPLEGRLAARLSAVGDARLSGVARLLRGLSTVDRHVYQAVAGLPTPWLDGPLRRASRFADFSKPWLLTAGTLAVFGGTPGRRAAATGVAAIGATSFLVNQPLKLLGRDRPQRSRHGVPETRWVTMPESASFPSGHSASAAAFCVATGALVPRLRRPLRAAAAVVAFSRVYTGVHYPGDVLVGASVGAGIGWVVGRCGGRASSWSRDRRARSTSL